MVGRGRVRVRAPWRSTGREERVVDARRHDLDAARASRRRGGRAARPPRCSDARIASEQPMTSASASHAALRLRVAGLGLHPGQRVERGDERQPELVLEPVPGQARQPVVGVDDVGAAWSPRGRRATLSANSSTVSGSASFGGRADRRRCGRTRNPGSTATSGQAVAPRAHVHRAIDARLGQRRDELAHVHVHAAAVAGARLGERARCAARARRGDARAVSTLLGSG